MVCGTQAIFKYKIGDFKIAGLDYFNSTNNTLFQITVNMCQSGRIFNPKMFKVSYFFRVFHGFGQAKFAYDGSILGLSQFALLLQLPLKMVLSLKVVKIGSPLR